MAHRFTSRLQSRTPLLYAIVDASLVGGEEIVAVSERLVEAGVDLVQLRAKKVGSGTMLQWVRAMLPVCRAREVPLIVNDRVDVALVAGADGVHLGEDDLPPSAARRLLGPDVLVGWSTHGLRQVREAPSEADYLGLGAIHPTRTRRHSRVIGGEALTRAREATRLPIFAIGGLNAGNIAELGGLGLNGVAVASALLGGPSVESAVRDLRAALARWR